MQINPFADQPLIEVVFVVEISHAPTFQVFFHHFCHLGRSLGVTHRQLLEPVGVDHRTDFIFYGLQFAEEAHTEIPLF